MEEFIMKTKVYMGEHALSHLHDYKSRKTLLVCDPFMEKSGMAGQIVEKLEQNGTKTYIFSKVEPDPDIRIVSEGIRELVRCQADLILALGGGSAIDTAKAMRLIYCEEAGRKHIPLLAIPTTSGTGSEVTSFAVISDRENQEKYALATDQMVPDIALLDPELIVSVPPKITADTGVDVLTHALEAYVSTKSCDFSDAFAEKAAELIFLYLPDAVKHGQDLGVRARVHNASCMAGVAFNSASLGLCHGMAHALGGRFHLPHGCCNALLLPHVLEYNAERAPERYVKFAEKTLGTRLVKGSEISSLLGRIDTLYCQIGMKQGLFGLGISEAEYKSAIPDMAEAALADRCTKTNPRVPTKAEVEALYRKLL